MGLVNGTWKMMIKSYTCKSFYKKVHFFRDIITKEDWLTPLLLNFVILSTFPIQFYLLRVINNDN